MEPKRNEEKYYDTHWTPPGWDEKEWQIIWRKLWLLSTEELKELAKKLGTKFIDKKIQEQLATKSDFIEIIDDGVKAQELKKELDSVLRRKGIPITEKMSIDELDKILKEKGVK